MRKIHGKRFSRVEGPAQIRGHNHGEFQPLGLVNAEKFHGLPFLKLYLRLRFAHVLDGKLLDVADKVR